jgi:hypothetical protein
MKNYFLSYFYFFMKLAERRRNMAASQQGGRRRCQGEPRGKIQQSLKSELLKKKKILILFHDA